MTALPLEHPTSPFVELEVGRHLSPEEVAALTAANAGADPEQSWREALLAYRSFAMRRGREELLKKTVLSDGLIRNTLDTAWQMFAPAFKKVTGPMIAEAYIRAFQMVDNDRVPIEMIYALADEHANRVGKYFNDTSNDAMLQGFNTFVNRQVPQRAAIEKVLDAYGLTPRQMSGYVNATALNPSKVESSLPRAAKAKVKSYIGRSIADRLNVFQRQEAHNLDQQASQVAWMWMMEHNRLPKETHKMWVTARDERVCKQCGPMDRAKVPVGEQFTLPSGDKLYVPGAHVNCRCEARLQINPLTVVDKRYDPNQPRGRDGKWQAGHSMYKDWAVRLNAMETPRAQVLEGTAIHRSAQALGYVTRPNPVLTPLRERDREMLTLARGASAWSRHSTLMDRARKMSDRDNDYWADRMKLRGLDKGLFHLMRALESAPANSPVLYRGMSVPAEHLRELQPGYTFELPPTSWSSDHKLSRSFAVKWGPMIARNRARREGTAHAENTNPVMFVLEPKSQALHIAPLVSERQAEWICKGTYIITNVEQDDDGLTKVYVAEHKEKIAKIDFDPKEHPRGGDPKNAGRFSRKEKDFKDVEPATPEVERITEEAAAQAELDKRIEAEERAYQIRRAAEQPVELGLPVELGGGKPVELTSNLSKPTELVSRSQARAAQLGGDKEVELIRGRVVELRTPDAKTAAVELKQRIPEFAASRQKMELDLRAAFAEMERRALDRLIRTEPQRAARRIRTVLRESQPFGWDRNGSPIVAYAVGSTFQVDDYNTTEDSPLGMVEIEPHQEFQTPEELHQRVLDTLDEQVYELVEGIMDDGRNTLARDHPTLAGEKIFHSFSEEELLEIATVVAHQDRPWAASRTAVVQWYDFENNPVGDPEYPTMHDLGNQLAITPEDFEVAIFEATEGYADQVDHSPGTRYGFEYWRAPGTFKITGDYIDDELLEGVRLHVYSIEPFARETIIDEHVEGEEELVEDAHEDASGDPEARPPRYSGGMLYDEE